MNVYQQKYSEEFIKELPVDFYKIKNTDLSKIPTDFHPLFTTDWNWGRYSKLEISERQFLQRVWLEYMHHYVNQR
jgi:hypothetical protein